MAGLATAGQLAREGMKVTLFEKNSQVGGRCQSKESTKVKGYRRSEGRCVDLRPLPLLQLYKLNLSVILQYYMLHM